jgi:hypothetical protein
LIEGQNFGGVAEIIDEPTLGDDLHPAADAGGTSANPHQAEVAILKSLEDATNQQGITVNWCGMASFKRLSRRYRHIAAVDSIHETSGGRTIAFRV